MKKISNLHLKTILISSILLLSCSNYALAQSSLPGDANGDGKVNGADYLVWFNNYKKSTSQGALAGDFNGDTMVNGADYLIWFNNYGRISPTPTPSGPTPTPVPATISEWTQFGHDVQRTNFTTQTVALPWKHIWQWNGSGSDAKTQTGHLSVPGLVQPITGGSRIYMVSEGGVYALNKTNGNVMWSNTALGALNSSPVYNNELLYVASTNGNLYKINASTGAITGTFNSGKALNYAPLLVNNRIYLSAVTNLISVNTDNMTQVWSYNSGNTLVTAPAYSTSRNLLIANSQDLYVHAVNAVTGAQVWKVKPTINTYSAGSIEFNNSWPVVAENHGIVFVRYRLPWTTWTDKMFPNTNSEIKSYLQGKPGDQALFAINLDSGLPAWPVSGKTTSWSDATSYVPPAVGNGGSGDGGSLSLGPKPVVAITSDGKEVVYIIWRNALTCGGCSTPGNCPPPSGQWCDGREDATMGEMVLDASSVSGYQAGDVRFIKYQDTQTDEMMNLTMSKDIIFHGHWLINAAARITNRSSNLGLTFTNPIASENVPFVIWRQCTCPGGVAGCTSPCDYPGCSNPPVCQSSCTLSSSRYCSQGLYSYGDTRSYPPGFYEYMNDRNGGSSPYTIVSANQVLLKTNDGALMVFENGSPTANADSENLITDTGSDQTVLGVQNSDSGIPVITYDEADNYINKVVTITGRIVSAKDNLPKAIYLGFTDPHDGYLLLRIFAQDLSKFTFDPMTLKGKNVQVTGKITLYWPENVDPEIILTDPRQLEIVE
ncbi:MAG TPA: PQQ-binding-like beta-propeller repeat protein [Patescibacteria group bacterium]|nr:PQQ-binding-like beta-propeller repeat protein [Patescibacteria group bacterium]